MAPAAVQGTLPLFVTVTASVRCSPRSTLVVAEIEYAAEYVAGATAALIRSGTATSALNADGTRLEVKLPVRDTAGNIVGAVAIVFSSNIASRETLVRDGDVDVLEVNGIAEVLGGAIECLWHGVVRMKGALRPI